MKKLLRLPYACLAFFGSFVRGLSEAGLRKCTACGHVGQAKRVVPGFFLVEIFAYCCVILPGLFYTSWRSANTKYICTNCRSTNIIPIDSPKLAAGPGPSAPTKKCPACAESIQAEAKICRFCRHEFVTQSA